MHTTVCYKLHWMTLYGGGHEIEFSVEKRGVGTLCHGHFE